MSESVVRQKCISIDSPSEWKEALKGIGHAFAHTWENCFAMWLTTGLDTYLYCIETNNVRIVCPISERGFEGYVDITTPYGFSGFAGNGDFPSLSEYWTSFVERRGYVCGYISLNPILENSSYFERTDIYWHNEIYVLDLSLSEDELFANLSINRKRRLKNWNKILNNSIVLEEAAVTDCFLANYPTFSRKKNASRTYDFCGETLSFLAGLDSVLVVGAQNSGKVEAVTVFAYTPYVGDFLFNVSLPEGQHHSVALLWYGVKHLKSLQIPFLNLGGGVRENDGIAKFKQRFGGKRLALGRLKQVYEPRIYKELCQRMNTDHTDMTGYFPAYRRSP